MENLDLETNQESFEGISLDVLEQHQAQEQARLLKRFRELREWQQQQQQQLMRQQQQQLLSLQTEQSKVQSLLATQRGPESGYQGALRSFSPVITPPRNAVRVNHVGPKVLPKESGLSHDSGLVMSMQDTLKSQNSLPKPVMYINPNQPSGLVEDDKYTNSELFSNVDSQDDHGILEDENHRDPPYPDWMSDTSENFRPPKLPPPRPLKAQLMGSSAFANRDQLAGLEELLNTAPPDLLEQVLGLLPGHANVATKTAGAHEVEKSASPALAASATKPRDFQTHYTANMYSGQSARTEDNNANSDAFQKTVFDNSTEKTQVELNKEGLIISKGPENFDDDDDDDVSYEECTDSGEDDDGNVTPTVQAKDGERPIQGTHGLKSFQQLLEEQLQFEEAMATSVSPEREKETEPSRPRQFLRKGEGIARFNSAPVKRPKPRQSQKSRNRPPSMRTDKDMTVDRNAHQSFKRIQTGGGIRDKEGQTKESAIKQLPPVAKKNVRPQAQDPEPAAKSSSHLSIIHSAAQKKKEKQKVRGEENMPPPNKAVPSRPAGRQGPREQFQHNLNLDQSPSVISSATDEQDLTELDSLAEFELLEDAADNMSFCSNSSIVKKLVCLDQQSHKEAVKKLKTISDSRKKVSDKEPTAHSTVKETAQKPPQQLNDIQTVMYQNNNNNNSTNLATNSQIPLDELRDLTSYFSNAVNESNSNGCKNMTLNNPVTSIPSSQGYFGFPVDSAVKGSPPTDMSTIPRAIFLNSEEAPLTSPPSSGKTMTRKVAPISAKFTEANDTLSLLKSLSQKAGLMSSDKGIARAVSLPNSARNIMGNAEDDSGKTVSNANTMFSGFTQSNDFYGQKNDMSPFNLPQTSSQRASNTDWLSSSNGFQSANGPSKYFSGLSGDEPQVETIQNKLSTVTEEQDDAISSDDDDDDEDDESGTCESGDDQPLETKNVNTNAMIVSDPHPQPDFNLSQRYPVVEAFKDSNVENKFNDNAEWTEDDEEEDEDRPSIVHIESRREKVIGAPAIPSSNVPVASSPPTSGLVSKLFPQLNPKQPSIIKKVQGTSANENAVADGIQSRVLRDKLKELDHEIERFRSENARLNKLRREREEGLEKLKQQIQAFQKEKEEELKRFENFKMQEIKKFKREKKQFDNYQKKMRSMPARKEKEEIDALQGQLEELQDELKRKETRWTSSTARLKNRLSELESENGELREEIRILEKKRLEWMSQPKASKATSKTMLKKSSEEAIKLSSETPFQVLLGSATDQRESTNESNRVNKASTSSSVLTPTTSSAMPKMSANLRLVESNKGISQINGTLMANGMMGDGVPVQNNLVPVMAEDTLLNQNGAVPDLSSTSAKIPSVPASSNLNTAQLESSSSLGSSNSKSAAVVAMEKTVIDKGNVLNCKETRHKDGKVEKVFETGAKEIRFPNGTVKEISADGQTIVCRLANGDIRQIFPDHRVVYIFAKAQIMQTSYPDGLEIFNFKNGQIEKRYPDGTVEITFPSKDIKYLFPDGGQEVILTDGTVMQYTSKGERTVEYPSGDREVHTAEYQRREFPDGIVKTIYSDGRHETRFPNGRVRLRDKAGNVIMDQICQS